MIGEQHQFKTTQWTQVLEAAKADSATAEEALNQLCRQCWYPVYAYIRHKGHSLHDANDLAQGFFEHLLRSSLLARADRTRGRFRSFLLGSLRNFLANQRRREQRLKRGGDVPHLALDFSGLNGDGCLDLKGSETPEELFERQWASDLIGRAMVRLTGEAERTKQLDRFLVLKPALTGEGKPYAVLASELSLREAAVKKAVQRLRNRYRDLIKEEVQQVVSEPDEVLDELQYLIRLLRSS